MNRDQLKFGTYLTAIISLLFVEQSEGYNVHDAVSPNSLPLIQNILGEENSYAGMDRLMVERWNCYANVFSIQNHRSAPVYGNGINDHIFMNDVDAAIYFLNPLWLFNEGGATCWSEFLSDSSDIVYDADWWPGTPDAVEHKMFRGTVLHELGHALGLGHNFFGMSVMNYNQPEELEEHLFPDDIKYLLDSFPARMTHVEDLGIWAFHTSGEKAYERASIEPLVVYPGGTLNVTGLYIGNMMTKTAVGAFVDVYLTPVNIYSSEMPGLTPASMWVETFIVDDMAPATGYNLNLEGITLPINMPAGAYKTAFVVRRGSGIVDAIEINNVCELTGFVVVNDPYEDDDSQQQARLISDGCNEVHNLFPPGDEDWVMFDLESTSAVEIVTENTQLYVATQIWLYNQASGLIAHEPGDGDYAYLNRFLGPGRYYVRVTCDLAYPDSCYNYRLKLRIHPGPEVTGRILRQDNGQGLDGVSVVFSAGAGTATTAGGGYFSHPVPYGWSGTVTPSLSGWQFSPGSISYNSPVTQSPTPISFIGSALPVAHIQTREDALSVVEGSCGWIGVRLSQDPGSSVVVSVQKVSGDEDLTVSTGSSLTFNSSNWQTYQSARVDAAEDSDKLNGMATIRCSASGWAPKDVVVTENDNDGGWVRVMIEPAQARTAGAQWRINQGAWHNSGETAYSAPWVQDFTIQFKDVPGWFTPPTQKGLLNSFTPSLVATGTYIGASSGEGSLTIRIMPDQAISAGGRWRADGGAWRNSGDVAYGLSAGTHTVEFEQLAGYIKPANQSVNINGGNLTENYGIFSPTDTSIMISPGDNIQNAINNASSGHTIVLNPGTYNITTNIFITKGVTLRSLNGPASTTVVLPGTRIHCISVGHSNAVVDGITFTGADYWQSGEGGGAYCSQGIMLNCVSSGNIAGYGAGFFCGGSGALYNCWADNNQSYYGGGGLYIIGNGRAFSCVAKNNTVRNDYEGGGIYAYGGYVSNCLSTGNGTGYNGDGAGGYFRNTVVDRSVFAANTAHDAGGGCVLGDNAALRNALIENNTADNGGGIYVDGSTGVRIESCAIRGNRATGFHGGAGWCRENTLISNCVVVGNASGQRGGAFAGNDRYSVVSSVIASNTAGTQGGAIYAGYEANLVNCLIFRNTATDGGGVWDYTGSAGPSINGCTIVYNHATGKGGGIYSDGNPRAQMIRNSIVMSNTASSSHPNYFEWDTGDLRYEYSCASPLPAGAGNINSNPKFVNSSANDYRLQSSSPCIDKGTATGAPSIDIAGVPRPLDGDGANGPAHDMGAYEYAPPSGSVIVRIEPVYAIDAGAKWSLDGVAWRGSDEVVDYVAAGPQTIVFSNISGWAQPAPVGIAVVAGSVSATNGTYLPLSADTDGDEIPDEWEIEHFGRLTNVNFSSDFDGDHLTDYYEQLAGTDPRDPTSCLVFTEDSISAVPGLGVSLRWYSGTGVSYRVCRTTNLVNGFQVIAPVVSGASPMTFYTDPSHSGRTFFYRIEKNP